MVVPHQEGHRRGKPSDCPVAILYHFLLLEVKLILISHMDIITYFQVQNCFIFNLYDGFKMLNFSPAKWGKGRY